MKQARTAIFQNEPNACSMYGTAEEVQALIAGILQTAKCPVVLDADGINAVCAGASGAICGTAGALAFYMLKTRKENKNFSFLRWAIFLALVVGQGFGNAGVDNAAHVGGFICGFLAGVVLSFGIKNKNNGGIING